MAENVFEDKALQKYLNDIAKIPTLTREEEHELAIKAKAGDERALDKLIQSNLKFVVKIASHYQNRGLQLAELISEGNMGLIKAIEKFDPDKDIKLISYGVWWIRQRILFALAEKTSLIRMPLGKSNAANKIKEVKEKIFNKTGHRATMEEIQNQTDLNKKIITKIEQQATDTISLDDISYTNKNDKVQVSDFIKDPESDDPKSLYYREKVHDSIEESISKLPERDSYIIKSYFGLNGEKGKNFAQIAEELGLSRERVRQIQKAALKKIYKDSYKEVEHDIDYILKYKL